MRITNSNDVLAYAGESLTRTIYFSVEGEYSDYNLYLDIKSPVDTLRVRVEGNSYLVPNHFLKEDGICEVQLVANKDDYVVKSAIRMFRIDRSINASKDVEDDFPLEDIYIKPSRVQRVIEPLDGYYGIHTVTIEEVTADIDTNIKPENIIKGVNILGVEGNASGFSITTDEVDAIFKEVYDE